MLFKKRVDASSRSRVRIMLIGEGNSTDTLTIWRVPRDCIARDSIRGLSLILKVIPDQQKKKIKDAEKH